MSDDVVYYNQALWSHNDKLISSTNLNVDKFVAKDKWTTSPPKLKFSITHYKTRTSSQITLSHQEVFNFLQQFKKYEDKIGQIIKDITDDQNKQYSLSVKNKKNLFITFLHKSEYNGACIRVVISEKNSDYLDSEKVYLSIYDFLSLVVVMGQFRNQYITIVDSIHSIIAMNELAVKISDVDNKLTSFYSELSARNKLISNENEIQKRNLPREYDPLADVLDNMTDADKKEIIEKSIAIDESNRASSSSSGPVTPEDKLPEIIHDDMTSFIKEKRDSFDLGVDDEEVPKSKANTEAATVMPSTFTEKMLGNDIANLEMYMMNLINDELPFSKFSELIKGKLGFDALEGVSTNDENCADYLISLFLKAAVKDNLDKKQEIPASIPPLVFDSSKLNDNKISLAYDLYLYCIYYSHIRNVLKDKDYGVVANKELVTFALKTISSPYVFSLIKNIDETVLVAEIVNRYRRYRAAGVFDAVEKTFFDSRGIKISLTDDAIKTDASRIYSIVVQKWDNLTIDATFKARNSILKQNDFKQNKLSKEQIKKILAAEFSFRKNKKVDFKEAGINGFDDIPLTISEKYGIVKLKFDNTNLKRFVKEKCKDNESILKMCLEIVDLVNESYKDLKDKQIDYSVIPEDVLKAVYMWDLKTEPKFANNYIYFIEQVQRSTLSRDMIISLLLNISDANDPDFTNSFMSARDE